MAVHVCFYTHTWEIVWECVLVQFVCLHAWGVCVCVISTAKPLRATVSESPFCFSVVTVTGQEELVSPPCMMVLPHLHDLVWSGFNGQGGSTGQLAWGWLLEGKQIDAVLFCFLLACVHKMNICLLNKSAHLWSFLISLYFSIVKLKKMISDKHSRSRKPMFSGLDVYLKTN